MNSGNRKLMVMAVLSAFAGAGIFKPSIRAQAAPGAGSTTPAGTTVMEKFEVTGSYLPAAANAVAIPVITLDADAIQRSGENISVFDVLRKTSPQFSGNLNLGPTNGNVASNSTNGGSQISIRNSTTLVLINGRRMAYAPVDATGGYQFVDVNLIPVSAIERIDILPDGASATYGTDAVAGVVNIILKTKFEGVEVGGRYGFSTQDGHYAERSGYVVGGVGNGKTNITIGAEWARTDPIFNYERDFSNPTFGTTSFAGSVNVGTSFYTLAADRTAPTPVAGGQTPAQLVAAGVYTGPRTSSAQLEIFNLSRYVTQVIGNERQSATVAAEHKVNDVLAVFGDFLYAKTKTFSQLNAQPVTATAAAGSPGNPFNTSVTVRNRFVENPRQFFADTTNTRGVAGIRGSIADWTWEGVANYNVQRQDYRNLNLVNTANRIAAVSSGRLNLFAVQQAPGAIEASGVFGTAIGNFESGHQEFDFHVNGKLLDLPAGRVDIALGAETRRETLSADADVLSHEATFGWDSGVTIDPFDRARKVGSLFAEVRVPLLANLPGAHLVDVSGAVRHEFYSDTTNPTVPKFTLRYLPFNDEFALRATYSKSFVAPTLFQLFGPSGLGFTDPFTLRPLSGTPIQNWQSQSSSGSNPSLIPSKSENFTVGMVYSPKTVKGLSLSVDYISLRQRDVISTIGASTILQDVELLGTSSTYAPLVHFGSLTGPGVTGAGQISNKVPDDVFVTDRQVNIAATKVASVDAAVKYTHNLGSEGRVDFGVNATYYRQYLVRALPTDPYVETAGHSTDSPIGGNGTLPRWAAYSSVGYRSGDYEAFVGNRFIPAFVDANDGERIGAWTSWDASVAYRFAKATNWRRYLNGARFSVGVNNVLDRMPPRDATIFTDSNADIAYYGSVGRFVYFDLKFKF